MVKRSAVWDVVFVVALEEAELVASEDRQERAVAEAALEDTLERAVAELVALEDTRERAVAEAELVASEDTLERAVGNNCDASLLSCGGSSSNGDSVKAGNRVGSLCNRVESLLLDKVALQNDCVIKVSWLKNSISLVLFPIRLGKRSFSLFLEWLLVSKELVAGALLPFFLLTPLVMHEAGSVLHFTSTGSVARLECTRFLFILVIKSSKVACSRLGSGETLAQFPLEELSRTFPDCGTPRTFLPKSDMVVPLENLVGALM